MTLNNQFNSTQLNVLYSLYIHRLYYHTNFGGVCALSNADIKVVNGFSNKYYGWGGEDDDMFLRYCSCSVTNMSLILWFSHFVSVCISKVYIKVYSYSSPRGVRLKCYYAFFLVCCGCDTSYIVSIHIQCQASIYTLSLCRGHSWRVRLAKQETLTPPGHLVSPLVCRGPWMSTVVLYCWCHSDSASVLLYFTL